MDKMPWRFLVLTEAGAASERSADPIVLGGAGADGWLATVAPEIKIQLGAGAKTRSVELCVRDGSALDPAAIVTQLTGSAGAPAQAEMDALLHNPAFQTIESLYLGLRLLREHAGDEVQVQVLSARRKDLGQRFREKVFAPGMAGGAPPVGLILADFDFTHRADDLALLMEMGEMCGALQTPFVAAASPAFFELRHMAHLMALPDLVGRMMDPPHAAWRTFQAEEGARWIVLTLNRYLQRTPYEVEGIGYKETADDAHPETFLWGRAVWLVGAAAARSIRTHGHALDLSGRGGFFDGLPVRTYPVVVNESAPLTTEVPIPDEKAQELSRAGFAPVMGKLRSNVAVLPMVVTCFRLRPGRLTVEATLAYQMLAGRLAQFCGFLLDQIPAGDEALVASFVKDNLISFLGVLAGENPDQAVSVKLESVETDSGHRTIANVQVRPAETLEGKQLEFGFALPLKAV